MIDHLARTLIGVVLLLPVDDLAAQASSTESGFVPYAALGAIFSGGSRGVFEIGLGGEVRRLPVGVGFAGEAGYTAAIEEPGTGDLILSAGGTYTFQREEAKSSFFVSGGGNLIVNSGSAGGGYVGLGLRIGSDEKTPVRVEVRDQFFSGFNILTLRIGLVLKS